MSARPQDVAEVVFLCGLSGAGKSTSADVLEDLGYTTIENLPPQLVRTILNLSGDAAHRFALGVDARDEANLAMFRRVLDELRRDGIDYRIVFVEAEDEVLVSRYAAARRPHPLAPTGTILEGITRERARLGWVRDQADVLLDTTELAEADLRRRLQATFGHDARMLFARVVSFGFKHGAPRDVDLLFDVRFLPNPYWVPELRPLTGHDARVREYVLCQPAAAEFLDRTAALLDFLLPQYLAEGRTYLTVGVACTGGRHRSPVLAEELVSRIAPRADVAISLHHRDMEKD